MFKVSENVQMVKWYYQDKIFRQIKVFSVRFNNQSGFCFAQEVGV